jgi:hypothetical protein
MALGVPRFVRIGAAIAGFALVAACTPDPEPTTTSTPASPSTASSTPSATPTETEIERQQRMDWEAAEAAYRAAVAETERLARSGGTKKASSDLKAVATGDYLEPHSQSSDVRRAAWRLDGFISVVGSPLRRWTPDGLALLPAKTIDLEGTRSPRAEMLLPRTSPITSRRCTVVKISNLWKVSDVVTRRSPRFRARIVADDSIRLTPFALAILTGAMLALPPIAYGDPAPRAVPVCWAYVGSKPGSSQLVKREER